MKLKSKAWLLIALFAAGMAGARSIFADGKARELGVRCVPPRVLMLYIWPWGAPSRARLSGATPN